MIVMKFGGTSTQDAAAMGNVAAIVRSRLPEKPFVVISAIARATNALEQAGRSAAEGEAGRSAELLKELLDRHVAILDALIHDAGRHAAILTVLRSAHGELLELVKGVAILRELTPRTLDSFYCYGELLSSRLIAAVLQEQGIDAVWLDTREFMITDDEFTKATPLAEEVERRLNALAGPLLAAGKVPVSQGFIGVTKSGRRTTMGRESSDYSAAVIGAALRASDIQIWTDVDGILTADPRVVGDPRKVKVLSFTEAYELSFFGAKVLHPSTMLPAIEKAIPIHVYNSKRPQRSGTLVTTDPGHGEPIIKSIAHKPDVSLLTISPRQRFGQYIFWEHLYNVLTKHGAAAQLTATSEYRVAIVLDAKAPLEALLHELSGLGDVGLQRDKAILCLVGSELGRAPKLQQRLFNALADVTTYAVAYGPSASSLSLVLDNAAAVEAVRSVHREFFTGPGNEAVFEPLDPQGR
jgi:aspartate kinase